MSENKSYTEEVRGFEETVKQLTEELSKFMATQKEHNKKIETALLGNDFGDEGIVGRISRLEGTSASRDKVSALERESETLKRELTTLKESYQEFKNKTLGYAAGIGAVASIVISLIMKFVL